jgi:hypothetical protein
MPFEAYLKRGLLKRQKVDFRQIEKQIICSKKDLLFAKETLPKQPNWAATIAYHAILRAGRALIFSRGYLPADGAQHKTVVEITGKILGPSYSALIRKFEKMRRNRNFFFYDADISGSLTEGESALQTARELAGLIEDLIKKENPQTHFDF